jgi:hypothetical protein
MRLGLRRLLVGSSILAGTAGVGTVALAAGGAANDGLVRQSTPEKVLAEHLDALNSCDLKRLMAQYPRDVQLHFSDGQVVVGRTAVRKLFVGFVKPQDQGGLCGLRFTTERSFKIGDTFAVQYRVTAPFLKRTYRGSDAYITRDGLMVSQVSTFRASDLKTK